jgi:hypothetical protein
MRGSMSKKTKKKRRQKSFPWALVALGGLFAIGAIFVFSNSGSADTGGTPAISVDEPSIDMGYIKLGEYRSINIKVTNTGAGTLRFKEQPYTEVLEGCCPPQLSIGKMALKPGESTYVQSPDFMMHAGMDGKHDFGIHLKTNDPENPDFLVHILSDWGP